MNIQLGLNYGTSLIKAIPKIKFNPSTIGYRHTNGQISFVSQDAAINYAKNRVVKALNYNKPFERGILIEGNVICSEVDGKKNRVLIPKKNLTGKNFITVHGHPDAVIVKEGQHPCIFREILFGKNHKNGKIKQNGIAFPTSLSDYRSFMLNPNERKAIVYNSKGEFSILTKKESGISMNQQEFNEISNEYYMTVHPFNGVISVLKHIFNKIYHGFQSSVKAEKSMIEEADKLSQDIHEFLTQNTDKYGVIYETNYSNLIKK